MASAWLWWSILGAEALEPALLRDGDIVLHKSRSAQSEALRAATGSPYTHTGLVFLRDGVPAVLEATGPVQWTPLEAWGRRGSDGHVAVMRPKGAVDAQAVRAQAEGWLGRPYDLVFRWSDDQIYCSELVHKAYQRAVGLEVGALVPLASFDLRSPAVRSLIQRRVGEQLDQTEVVVAPASLLQDEDLRLVYTNDPMLGGS